jgi:hypothetical protein
MAQIKKLLEEAGVQMGVNDFKLLVKEQFEVAKMRLGRPKLTVDEMLIDTSLASWFAHEVKLRSPQFSALDNSTVLRTLIGLRKASKLK